jgi:hypothetical protein
MVMGLSREIAPALAATVRPIVVRLTGAVVTEQLATGRVANVQAPIEVHRIAAVRIELATAKVLRDVAPAETSRDAMCRADPAASVRDRAVRRRSFRHSLAKACD